MTSQQPLTHISRPEGVTPGPGYSHVVTGTGRLVAVSGQVAIGEDGQLVGPGDPAAQASQVFENLRRCLAAAGLSFNEVIKLTYYVTDVAHLPAGPGNRRRADEVQSRWHPDHRLVRRRDPAAAPEDDRQRPPE
jgi:enamine deaminase RidA (YjgF/YER057c/UK114 family)